SNRTEMNRITASRKTASPCNAFLVIDEPQEAPTVETLTALGGTWNRDEIAAVTRLISGSSSGGVWTRTRSEPTACATSTPRPPRWRPGGRAASRGCAARCEARGRDDGAPHQDRHQRMCEQEHDPGVEEGRQAEREGEAADGSDGEQVQGNRGEQRHRVGRDD